MNHFRLLRSMRLVRPFLLRIYSNKSLPFRWFIFKRWITAEVALESVSPANLCAGKTSSSFALNTLATRILRPNARYYVRITEVAPRNRLTPMWHCQLRRIPIIRLTDRGAPIATLNGSEYRSIRMLRRF